MHYHAECTEQLFDKLWCNNGFVRKYDDVFCGGVYLDAVQKGWIRPDNTLLIFLINDAQLFENKNMNCWIYIWIIFNLTPDYYYKKNFILPGAIIPGPTSQNILSHSYIQDSIIFQLYNQRVCKFGMLPKTMFSSYSDFYFSDALMALD